MKNSTYKLIIIIIKRSYAVTVFIEAIIERLWWKRQEQETILMIRDSRVSQVFILSTTLKGY